MPLDGTEFGSSESNLLSKLGAVERLLISEQQWCKGRLRDKDGRLCLAGAMQAVEAPQLLNSIILRAAKDVSGKRYWRIESFNDKPDTTHEDVLRVLRRARENIIAGIVEGDPGSRFERWAHALRNFCSGRQSAISAARLTPFARQMPGAGAVPPEDVMERSSHHLPIQRDPILGECGLISGKLRVVAGKTI